MRVTGRYAATIKCAMIVMMAQWMMMWVKAQVMRCASSIR